MIRFFVVLFYFGIFFSAYGQSSSDEQKKKDSVLLLTFSQELKKAVMTYDMKKIADFLHFPFPYSYCKAGGTEKRSGDTTIDRKDFLLIKYGDFFGCWFSETVSKGYVKDVFYVYEINGFCKLVFSIPT